jgi:HSP20 family protein
MNNTSVEKSTNSTRYEGKTMLPMVDVIEDAGGITLYADLPGVPKDKLHVRVEADVLAIEGEVSLPLASNMEASHVEIDLPRYQRTFTLGQELDREKLTAEFKQGVLRLHIPKLEHAKPRKIEVQVA